MCEIICRIFFFLILHTFVVFDVVLRLVLVLFLEEA